MNVLTVDERMVEVATKKLMNGEAEIVFRGIYVEPSVGR